MNMLYLTALGKLRPSEAPLRKTFHLYLERVSRYTPAEELALRDERALWEWKTRQGAVFWLVLLDPKGKLLSSEQFAAEWGRWRDAGKRDIVVAIGPADGWSPEARQRADFLLSLGPMTLPHELAAVVAAEQVYRVLTILAGHPYHCGH